MRMELFGGALALTAVLSIGAAEATVVTANNLAGDLFTNATGTNTGQVVGASG